jgi:hypothetical protein
MDMPVRPRLRAVAAIASAAALAMSLAAPAAAASSAHRGTQPDVGRTTGMRGPCYGGGKMSVIIAQPAGGGLSLHVATQGLREGSRWRGAVLITDLDGVADDQTVRVDSTPAVAGGFALDIPFEAVAHPSAVVSLTTPRGEECTSTVDTTTTASATCHSRRVITISAVQTRDPDVLAFVARLHGVRPGSKWANETSWRSKPETGSSGGYPYKASDDGVVEARITFIGIVIPNRAVLTTFDGPAGQHCSIQLGTHRLAATA